MSDGTEAATARATGGLYFREFLTGEVPRIPLLLGTWVNKGKKRKDQKARLSSPEKASPTEISP